MNRIINLISGDFVKKLPFKKSSIGSIGIELELQLIDPNTSELTSRAKDLIRQINASDYYERIKPEITQSMIEVNTGIHQTPGQLFEELNTLHQFLLNQTKQLEISICGGGTHPFQAWILEKIFPTRRFSTVTKKFRYLAKRSTVFGQHIHIGCANADDALYLTHALARYVPQFIAITAASPYYQGIDTGYYS